MESIKKPSLTTLLMTFGIGAAGVILSGVSVMYVSGMFGLSGALASQIVDAVQVGGLALAIVMGVLSGGSLAAAIGFARWAIAAFGKRVAVA